jgi:hypothetical protein
VNQKNVTVALIMVLANALSLVLVRASPTGDEVRHLVYVMIGCTTLVIIWMIFFGNE